jgi:putative N6-adenine-specific DNA methylase
LQNLPLVATTLKGLENVLAQEIKSLGGQNIIIGKRAVNFEGSEKLVYKANLMLRTALRILMPLDNFEAETEDELYKAIYDYPWEDLFEINQTFAIDTTVSGSYFNHSKYVALKAKDAIVDRFRDLYGRRPSIDKDHPDIKINIHVNQQEVSVALDSSGQSLDKRGYRRSSNEAPIYEVLAAGILLMTGFSTKTPLYDPMAGSGTFSIEAALIASNTPPGLNRKFAFEKWLDFNQALFNEVKAEVKAEVQKEIVNCEPQIFARDLLSENIDIIASNAENAGMDEFINLKKEDFFLSTPSHDSGIVLINPPYGERLKLDQSIAFYKRIGDTLKQNYAGFEAWVISSNLEAIKFLGLKTNQKIDLNNGGLDARLQHYSLFKGKSPQQN